MIAPLIVFALTTLLLIYALGAGIAPGLVIALVIALAFVQIRPWFRSIRRPTLRVLTPTPEEVAAFGRGLFWPAVVFVACFGIGVMSLNGPPEGVVVFAILIALAYAFGRALARLAHLEDLYPLFASMVGVALALAVTGPSPAPLLIAVPLALVLYLATWLHEFVFLMGQPDDAFPGRHDKLVWSVLLIVMSPLGLLAFHRFRRTHWVEERKPAPVRALHELT